MISKIAGWIKFIKMGAVVKGPAQEFIKTINADPDGEGPLKHNWQSTEFWATQAIPQAGMAWAAFQGIIPAKIWVTGSVSLAGLYLIARTGVKIAREIGPVIAAVKALKSNDLQAALTAVEAINKPA